MTQYYSQSLSQQMRLEQRLTPQLIQSMAILQKPVADLEAFIEEALESNAALEVVEPQPIESPDGAEAPRDGGIGSDNSEALSFERYHKLSRDYDLDAADRAPSLTHRVKSGDGRDAKMGAMANTEGRQRSLNEHLLAQWALVEVDEATCRAGEAIINHLDPDGYLRTSFETVSQSVRPPIALDLLESTLPAIQDLEPSGVAGRDVVECLLLQLAALPGDNELERRLVEHHLDDITHNRLPAVAKATGCSVGEISEALRAMRSTICLHPGFLIGDRSVPTLRPDVIVEYAGSGGGLTMRLTRGNMPELRVRTEVAKLAKTKENGKATRDFARKHVEDATALIDAVKFRHHRLLEVAGAIVEKQSDFFDVGPEGLKILRMSDLATEMECDPSTISRTVAEKYMQTPRGIFPLRYFFTGGTETDSGESMGWDRVKVRVKDLVAAEDKSNPLSDDQVAALLKTDGIEISRRTVAKYRQQMDIPAARQRREF